MVSLRVIKEIEQIKKNGRDVKIISHNENNTEIIAEINGPIDSPYENGTFQLKVIIPEQYPFCPPKINFETLVWHPNISSVTGAICIDILKDRWSPALNIYTVLISIQSLLSEPVPEDPQDAVVATQYLENFNEFIETAKQWVTIYALKNNLNSMM
jgi:ubiquitin-conjugating enzyme (huntingtin interacting protein 2)